MNKNPPLDNRNSEALEVEHLSKEVLCCISYSVIQSEHAVKYLTVLCRHFSRKVKTEWSDFQGTVYFNVGITLMKVDTQATELHFECKAANEDALEQQKAIINHHLALFARREYIALTWSAVESIS